MKKLKLTINGEVKTFDLPENGEYKCEVTESSIPKVGDCVMVSGNNSTNASFFKIVSINVAGNVKFDHCVDLHKGKYTIDLDDFWFLELLYSREFTQISPEELKAKYAEAGYDWDYETNKIKPLKWVPKRGDEVWFLNTYMKPDTFIFREDDAFGKILLEKDLLFQTEEDCQKFADHCMKHINNKNEFNLKNI